MTSWWDVCVVIFSLLNMFHVQGKEVENADTGQYVLLFDTRL